MTAVGFAGSNAELEAVQSLEEENARMLASIEQLKQSIASVEGQGPLAAAVPEMQQVPAPTHIPDPELTPVPQLAPVPVTMPALVPQELLNLGNAEVSTSVKMPATMGTLKPDGSVDVPGLYQPESTWKTETFNSLGSLLLQYPHLSEAIGKAAMAANEASSAQE